MKNFAPRSLTSATLALSTLVAVSACSDDNITTASASVGGTSTGGATDDPGTSTAVVTTESVTTTATGTATGTDSGVSGTDSDATTGSSTDALTSDPSTSTTSETTVDPSTSTTGDESTSTTGDDTTGGSTGDDTTGGGNQDECVLAQMHKPCDMNSDDALHAIGLNCTSLGGDWINNNNAVTVTNLSFQAPPVMQGQRAWQVAKSYGSYVDPNTQKPFWGPREGEKVLLISSGLLPTPNGQGAVIVPDSDVYNDSGIGGQWDSDTMPPPMSPQQGSPDPMGFTNCDGVNDCSNTLFDQWELGGGNAEDKMWFSFQVKAPAIANGDQADANGYTFDFAYFSAEFPEYVDTIFNDIFVVWQASEDYTGNVTFINGQPLTVTALWPIDFQGECDFFDPNCNGAAPQLQGTGHINDGGATGWYKATSGVKPGETFTLAFAIFDMGDSSFDTTAILDNWKWDCEGCVPNEVNSCGIDPQ